MQSLRRDPSAHVAPDSGREREALCLSILSVGCARIRPMAGERDVLEYLLQVLDSEGLRERAAVVRGRWVDRGLPLDPAEDAAGRDQLRVVLGVLRELRVDVRSMAYLYEVSPRGVVFHDPTAEVRPTLQRALARSPRLTALHAEDWSRRITALIEIIEGFAR